MPTWDELVDQLVLLAERDEYPDDTDELPEAPPIPETEDDVVAIFFGGLTPVDKHLKGTKFEHDQKAHGGHGARYGQENIERHDLFRGKVKPPIFTIDVSKDSGSTYSPVPLKMKRGKPNEFKGGGRDQNITGEFGHGVIAEILRSRGYSVALIKSKLQGGSGAAAADLVAIKGSKVLIVEAKTGSIGNGYGAQDPSSGRQWNVQTNQEKYREVKAKAIERYRRKGYSPENAEIRAARDVADAKREDRLEAHARKHELGAFVTKKLREDGTLKPGQSIKVGMITVLLNQDKRRVSLYQFDEVPPGGRIGFDDPRVTGKKGDGRGSAFFGTYKYKVKDWRDKDGETLPYLDRW